MVERLFPDHTPMLNLRPLHRELLNRALVGETDEDLAESLGLSVAAIKSRWKAVYQHIEQQNPALLSAWSRNTYAPAARARERRRHLLNYLREHIEELRPV
jgi:DNA-binding NarL/FixJ family response regulator